MRLNDDYVKITYETPPIGPSKIVLYLTTFDIEKYKKDQEVETKTKSLVFEEPDNRGYNSFADIRNSLDNRIYCDTVNAGNRLYNTNYYEYLQESLNNVVMRYYEPYVEELKREIDAYRVIRKTLPNFVSAQDVTNVPTLVCDTVCGDVTNCHEVHCNNIQGDLINCRVYKDDVGLNSLKAVEEQIKELGWDKGE